MNDDRRTVRHFQRVWHSLIITSFTLSLFAAPSSEAAVSQENTIQATSGMMAPVQIQRKKREDGGKKGRRGGSGSGDRAERERQRRQKQDQAREERQRRKQEKQARQERQRRQQEKQARQERQRREREEKQARQERQRRQKEKQARREREKQEREGKARRERERREREERQAHREREKQEREGKARREREKREREERQARREREKQEREGKARRERERREREERQARREREKQGREGKARREREKREREERQARREREKQEREGKARREREKREREERQARREREKREREGRETRKERERREREKEARRERERREREGREARKERERREREKEARRERERREREGREARKERERREREARRERREREEREARRERRERREREARRERRRERREARERRERRRLEREERLRREARRERRLREERLRRERELRAERRREYRRWKRRQARKIRREIRERRRWERRLRRLIGEIWVPVRPVRPYDPIIGDDWWREDPGAETGYWDMAEIKRTARNLDELLFKIYKLSEQELAARTPWNDRAISLLYDTVDASQVYLSALDNYPNNTADSVYELLNLEEAMLKAKKYVLCGPLSPKVQQNFKVAQYYVAKLLWNYRINDYGLEGAPGEMPVMSGLERAINHVREIGEIGEAVFESIQAQPDDQVLACMDYSFRWSRPHDTVTWNVEQEIGQVAAEEIVIESVNTRGNKGKNGVAGITELLVTYDDGQVEDLVQVAFDRGDSHAYHKNGQLVLRYEGDQIVIPLDSSRGLVKVFVKADSWISPDQKAEMKFQLQKATPVLLH